MVGKSEWSYHAATPVIGFSITGTFGAVVSLIITIGMSNVAGHTKKSFTAATIFVAYCIGASGEPGTGPPRRNPTDNTREYRRPPADPIPNQG